MAFAVSDFYTGVPKSDTNYLRWVASFQEQIDGVLNEIKEELHPCTEVDMAKFYPSENPA